MTDTSAEAPAFENNARKLGLANMWLGFGAFAAAISMGLYQVVERSNLFPAAESREVYYALVSTHGVLMAGAVMLTVSAIMFIVVVVRSHFSEKLPALPEVVFATA